MAEKPEKIYLGKGKIKKREHNGKTYTSITGPSFGFGFITVDIAEKDGEKVFYYTLTQKPKDQNLDVKTPAAPAVADDPDF